MEANEQSKRKARSESILIQRGININEWLPLIESEHDAVVRPSREIAQRLCALLMANMFAFEYIEGPAAMEYLQTHLS
jgi:hypothetical protein